MRELTTNDATEWVPPEIVSRVDEPQITHLRCRCGLLGYAAAMLQAEALPSEAASQGAA